MLKAFASFAMLAAVCCLHAADTQPATRAISVVDIETDDPAGYAGLIAKYNEAAKARLKVDNYIRVYESGFDSRTHGRVRAVISAPTISELMKNLQAMETEPAIVQLLGQLRGVRKMGARVLYRSVRFEGPAPKGAWNYNTLATVTDEEGYLKAIEELRSIFDAAGFKDVKMSVYRVVVGAADHTHRITISTPSQERLAAFLDSASSSEVRRWMAGAARLRTVVATSTSREITK